jgi:large subunit ribosomal protein L23
MALFKKKTEEKGNEEVKKPAQVKTEKKPSKKESKSVSKGSKVSYKVLVHPLITEKSTIQNSYNQYAFVVNTRATKVEIKKAIKETYGITPTKVTTQNVLGKMVRSGRRGAVTRQKDWKKAIVIIPEGKKIDVYEGV